MPQLTMVGNYVSGGGGPARRPNKGQNKIPTNNIGLKQDHQEPGKQNGKTNVEQIEQTQNSQPKEQPKIIEQIQGEKKQITSRYTENGKMQKTQPKYEEAEKSHSQQAQFKQKQISGGMQKTLMRPSKSYFKQTKQIQEENEEPQQILKKKIKNSFSKDQDYKNEQRLGENKQQQNRDKNGSKSCWKKTDLNDKQKIFKLNQDHSKLKIQIPSGKAQNIEQRSGVINLKFSGQNQNELISYSQPKQLPQQTQLQFGSNNQKSIRDQSKLKIQSSKPKEQAEIAELKQEEIKGKQFKDYLNLKISNTQQKQQAQKQEQNNVRQILNNQNLNISRNQPEEKATEVKIEENKQKQIRDNENELMSCNKTQKQAQQNEQIQVENKQKQNGENLYDNADQEYSIQKINSQPMNIQAQITPRVIAQKNQQINNEARKEALAKMMGLTVKSKITIPKEVGKFQFTFIDNHMKEIIQKNFNGQNPIQTQDSLYFPINYKNSHWKCVIIFKQLQVIQFLDSMSWTQLDIEEGIVKLLNKEQIQGNWKYNYDCPKQGNGQSLKIKLFTLDMIVEFFAWLHCSSYQPKESPQIQPLLIRVLQANLDKIQFCLQLQNAQKVTS